MSIKQVEEFENYKIQEGSLIFGDNPAVGFGCIGTVDATANVQEVEKKCEGITVKKIKRVNNMTVAITGHVKIPTARKIVGLSNEGFKTGVYGYGTDTFSNPFIFTAKVIDMDGNIKYIAFPKLEDVKGLSVKVNNDVTEIEMDDLEFTALKDSNNMFYYEMYDSESEDADLKTAWLTNFTPDLVKQTAG